MQQIFLNTLDALRRVQGFLDTQATALGNIIPPVLRARLDGAVTRLSAFQVEQSAATGTARGETVNQAGYRIAFVKRFMRPIASIAKSNLRNAGEFPTLVVPVSKLRDGDFFAAAQAFADSATTYQQVFLDGGMPADFLTQMRAAIAQLTTSKDARARNLSRRSAATDGIKTVDKTAREVLGVLDSLIAPALVTNSPLLADWNASKRIAVALTSLPAQPVGVVSHPAPTASDSTTATTNVASPAPATEPVVPSAPTEATPVAPAPRPATSAD